MTTSRNPEPDDNSLTLEKLVRAMRGLEADGPQDFWSTILRRFNVSKVAFSAHLPGDEYAYRLAAFPELGIPATLVIPVKYRRELPPLPSILNLASPTVFMQSDGVYQADGSEIERISEPLEPEA